MPTAELRGIGRWEGSCHSARQVSKLTHMRLNTQERNKSRAQGPAFLSDTRCRDEGSEGQGLRNTRAG